MGEKRVHTHDRAYSVPNLFSFEHQPEEQMAGITKHKLQ
jgi:hypothetical protein